MLLPLLQRLHTVRNLPDAAQRALCAVVGAAKCQQGEYIYRKDDPSDSSYVVLTGGFCQIEDSPNTAATASDLGDTRGIVLLGGPLETVMFSVPFAACDVCKLTACAYLGSVHLIIPGDPLRHPEDIELGVVRPGHGFGEVALVDPHIHRPSDAAAINSDCTLLRLSSDLYDLVVNALQTEELLRTVH